MKLILCSIVALLSFGTKASAAPDPNFHIYLCFGQSNMAELPKALSNSHVISSAECTSNDRLHFNSAGSREFGKRYGEKMLSILRSKGEAAQ